MGVASSASARDLDFEGMLSRIQTELWLAGIPADNFPDEESLKEAVQLTQQNSQDESLDLDLEKVTKLLGIYLFIDLRGRVAPNKMSEISRQVAQAVIKASLPQEDNSE